MRNVTPYYMRYIYQNEQNVLHPSLGRRPLWFLSHVCDSSFPYGEALPPLAPPPPPAAATAEVLGPVPTRGVSPC